MFKSIHAAVLSAVAAAVLIFPAPASTRSLDSVQPIQAQGQTFCTVFSINEKEGYFASAGHCALFVLEKDMDGKVTILGKPATVETIGLLYDVSVFHADVHIPALHLAKRPVDVCNPKYVTACEVISIQGFPYGLPKLVTVSGHVAARDVPLDHPSYHVVMYSDILDITTAGGNSGSPVMNSHGEVIGILWGGFQSSPHSLSIPLESLRHSIFGMPLFIYEVKNYQIQKSFLIADRFLRIQSFQALLL